MREIAYRASRVAAPEHAVALKVPDRKHHKLEAIHCVGPCMSCLNELLSVPAHTCEIMALLRVAHSQAPRSSVDERDGKHRGGPHVVGEVLGAQQVLEQEEGAICRAPPRKQSHLQHRFSLQAVLNSQHGQRCWKVQ